MTRTCYIGHTTATLKDWIKQQSSFESHHKDAHQESISEAMILPNISILVKSSDKINLSLSEALLIQHTKEIINIQIDDVNRTLTLFKNIMHIYKNKLYVMY